MRILFLLILSDSRPASKMNGTMINDGNDSSICSSKSLAFLKMFLRSPRIGEIAKPGNEVTIDME